jgi:hypothetical protein
MTTARSCWAVRIRRSIAGLALELREEDILELLSIERAAALVSAARSGISVLKMQFRNANAYFSFDRVQAMSGKMTFHARFFTKCRGFDVLRRRKPSK